MCVDGRRCAGGVGPGRLWIFLVRRSLVLVAVLVVAGAGVAVVLRRPAAPLPIGAHGHGSNERAVHRCRGSATTRCSPPAWPGSPRPSAAPPRKQPRGPRMRARRPGPPARPDAGGALAALQAAADGGIAPPVKAVLQELARLLADDRYPDAVERVHGLFRQHSDAAVPALELLTVTAQEALRGGGLRRIEPVLRRVEELPTADPAVRASVARLLGTAAVASAKAGQFDRSKLQARAALASRNGRPRHTSRSASTSSRTTTSPAPSTPGSAGCASTPATSP
jgi:hypothetical protein